METLRLSLSLIQNKAIEGIKDFFHVDLNFEKTASLNFFPRRFVLKTFYTTVYTSSVN